MFCFQISQSSAFTQPVYIAPGSLALVSLAVSVHSAWSVRAWTLFRTKFRRRPGFGARGNFYGNGQTGPWPTLAMARPLRPGSNCARKPQERRWRRKTRR